MLIVLEGPDGAGKTTLARALSKALGARIIHHGPYPGLDGVELARKYLDSMCPALGGADVIFDRSWLSEPIYAEVYRTQPSRISPEARRMLTRVALSAGVVVVKCLPPLKSCLQVFAGRAEDEYLASSKQLREVYFRYADLDTGGLPAVTYDYTETSSPPSSGSLVAESRPNLGPGGGCWEFGRSILIVGDEPNDHTHEPAAYQVPFISFNKAACSWWLATQLDGAGISEGDLYWVNAKSHAGVADGQAMATLRPRHVAALGQVASEWCQRFNLEHIKFAHPQFHKRFRYAQPYPFISWLKEVACVRARFTTSTPVSTQR